MKVLIIQFVYLWRNSGAETLGRKNDDKENS